MISQPPRSSVRFRGVGRVRFKEIRGLSFAPQSKAGRRQDRLISSGPEAYRVSWNFKRSDWFSSYADYSFESICMRWRIDRIAGANDVTGLHNVVTSNARAHGLGNPCSITAPPASCITMLLSFMQLAWCLRRCATGLDYPVRTRVQPQSTGPSLRQ